MFAATLQAGGQSHNAVSFSLQPVATTDVDSFGLPSVSVPVLSTTSVSTFSQRLERFGVLDQDARVCAAPVPTMIDIGVARPRAHGQAMISTATALTSACASRGSGPTIAQTMNVTTAMREHGRNEPGRDFVGEPLDRRAAALRLADHLDDLRQQRLAATRSARMMNEPVPLTRRADDAVARRLLDRDRFAGDHRFVDGAAAFEDHAVDGNFSPGRTRRRSPACTCSSGTPLRLPSSRR